MIILTQEDGKNLIEKIFFMHFNLRQIDPETLSLIINTSIKIFLIENNGDDLDDLVLRFSKIYEFILNKHQYNVLIFDDVFDSFDLQILGAFYIVFENLYLLKYGIKTLLN